MDDLRRAGAVVTIYRPAQYVQRWLGGGQHVKIQVSEAGEALFGSSNVSRSSFEGWNEYAVSLRGPVVRTLLESYRDIGGRVDESHLEQLDDATEGGDGGSRAGVLALQPEHAARGVRPARLARPEPGDRPPRRAHCRRPASIWITSFYFKPVEPLLAALVGAASRGVQVEVHHSHRDALPATDLAWIAAAANYDRLLAAGVRVYENRRGEHSKIVLIDGDWVAFGSYNFEHAAHDRLAEAMLASRDPRATQPAADIFAELREDRRQHPGDPADAARTAGPAQAPDAGCSGDSSGGCRAAHMDKDPLVPTDSLRFTEIEHKFVVDEHFDLARFRGRWRLSSPTGTERDRRPRSLLPDRGRPRAPRPVQASLRCRAASADGEGDSRRTPRFARRSISTSGTTRGNQDAQVDAFMDQLGVIWRGTLQKELEVWYFPDCEVVYYVASTATRSVRCVEFEATLKDSLDDALATVDRFERATGFESASRSRLSLPQLLFPDLNEALAHR